MYVPGTIFPSLIYVVIISPSSEPLQNLGILCVAQDNVGIRTNHPYSFI